MITAQLEERGMLDLDTWDRHNGGIARCCAVDCGWEGIPLSIRGRISTRCPACEKPETDEEMIALGNPPKPRAPKQGRNELCLCGSLKKWKYCHGR
jgi:hypothetical protein